MYPKLYQIVESDRVRRVLETEEKQAVRNSQVRYMAFNVGYIHTSIRLRDNWVWTQHFTINMWDWPRLLPDERFFSLLCLQQWSFHYIDSFAMQDVMHFPSISSTRRKTRSHTWTTSGQSIRLSDGGGCRCIVHACVCGPYRERDDLANVTCSHFSWLREP